MANRFFLTAAALLSLAACSSNPLSGMFGGGGNSNATDNDNENDDNRVAIVASRADLTPDPRFVGSTIDIPPSFANADWSQPGGEPDHVMHHLSGPEEFDFAWSASIGKGGSKRAPLTAPPVVADNKIFAIDTTAQVSSFDAETGSVLWRTSLTPDLSEKAKPWWDMRKPNPSHIGFGGGVAYDDGRLFMVSGFAFAAALDAETGEMLWQVDLPAPTRNPPTAVGGKLYLITTSNQLMALDQETGEEVWSYESFEENARFLSTGSPAVDGDLLVAPFSSGEVVALDPASGRLLWSATISRSSRLNGLSNLNDIAGSPVIDRGGVFAVSHAGQVSAIDGRSGRIAWEVGLGGLNMPWIAGEAMFVMSVEGDLVALSRNDGAVMWTRELPIYENMKKRKKPITWMGPVLVGDYLVMASSAGQMLQLSPQDGETVREYKLRKGTTIPPVVADGTLYIINKDARLEAWR